MSGVYASALGNLRDTVKWIVAAFTGAGAILFSGLAVTNISRLAEDRAWLLPVALAIIPLLAAIAAIIAALRVITVTPPSVGALFPEYGKVVETPATPTDDRDRASLVSEVPAAVAVYGTLRNFDAHLVAVVGMVRRTEKLRDGTPQRESDYEGTLARLDGLQPTVRDALDCAAYVTAMRRFRTASWQILAAAVVAVGGLVASGIVSGNRQAADSAPSVSFRDLTPVTVSYVDEPPPEAGGEHRCPLWRGIPAVAAGGTFERPLLLFPGYTMDEAEAHGVTPDEGCDQPWVWTADAGAVVVEPR